MVCWQKKNELTDGLVRDGCFRDTWCMLCTAVNACIQPGGVRLKIPNNPVVETGSTGVDTARKVWQSISDRLIAD